MKHNRTIAKQITALPFRWKYSSKLHVLMSMIASCETKRWDVIKGWLIDEAKPWETAKIEALVEAGAVSRITDQSIGQYHFLKQLEAGMTQKRRIKRYPPIVQHLKQIWKEQYRRKRSWFKPERTATRVDKLGSPDLLVGPTSQTSTYGVLAGMRHHANGIGY